MEQIGRAHTNKSQMKETIPMFILSLHKKLYRVGDML